MTGIRRARTGDAQAIARIEIETWQTTYAGILTDQVLLAMSPERLARRWTHEIRGASDSVLVWQGERRQLLGFGHCGRQRDGFLGYKGEVYMLYVLPDAQGLGIGRQLLSGLFETLVEQRLGSALIWVVRANPSRFFYERMGGKLVMQRRIPIGGQPVEAVGYGWTDLAAVLDRQARSGDRWTDENGKS
jgi:GNAT superfamily N-acetyltransferase